MIVKRFLLIAAFACLNLSGYCQSCPTIVFNEYRELPKDTAWCAPYSPLRSGELEEASKTYNKQQLDLLASGDYVNYLFMANEFSYWLYMERDREGAEKTLSSAIETANGKVANGHIEMLISNYNMAIYTANIQEKIEWYKRFLNNYSPELYPRFGFIINRDIGSRYYALGKYRKAWEHWDICQNRFEVDSTSLADLYNAIGSNIASHDPEIAIEYLLKGINIIEGIDKYLSDVIMIHTNVGRFYLQNADYQNAYKHSKKANDLLLANQDLSDFKFLNQHNRYTSIIESCIRLGDYGDAKKYLEEMRGQLYGFPNPKVSEGLLVFYESMMYRMMGEHDKALEYLEQFKEIFLEIIGNPLSPWLVNYYLDKADVLFAKGQYTDAIRYYENTLKSISATEYKTIEDEFKLLPPETFQKLYLPYVRDITIKMLEGYRLLAEEEQIDGLMESIVRLVNYANSIIQFHFSGIADERLQMETSKHLKKTSYYGLYAYYHLSNSNKAYIDSAFTLSDKPRAFNLNFLKQIASHYAGEEMSSVLKSINELTVKIANHEIRQENNKHNDRLFELRAALYRAKVDLTEEYQSLIQFVDNHGIANHVKTQLEDNDATIQYFAKGDSLFLICYTAKEATIHLIDFSDYENKVKRFTREIKTGSNTASSQALFYKKLIKPIEKQLEGVTDLHIFADDQLLQIPFEMFKDNSDQLLVSKYSISYYYSARSFQKNSRVLDMSILAMAPEFRSTQQVSTAILSRSAIDTLEIFRTSDDRASLVHLPHSMEEVEGIASLFESNKQKYLKVTGSGATKGFFEQNQEKYNILHIATHGISSRNRNSGLVFAISSDKSFDESYLSLPELYKLNITADLVVLSACQTGVGDILEGEGIMALPRGFIYSNVPNIIASLWKVHDEKTKELMLAFYRHLLSGESYAQALRLAKLECIQKGFLPLDWASFVLIKG